MSESPYELQRLVVVGTFSTPWEAQIAQARLSAEGLHSLIADEHVIRMVALANAIGGIHLKVRERDAEAAAEVLRRLAPLPEIYLVSADGSGGGGADGEQAAGEAAPAEPAAGAAGGGQGGGWDAGARRASGARQGSSAGWGSTEGRGPTAGRGSTADRGSGDGWVAGDDADAEDRGDTGDRWDDEDDGTAPLTTAARFHTPWEAHLARTLLESEGVRCCVMEERLPAVHLLSAEPAAFNRLEVRQADAARAAAILARAFSSPSLVAVPDPDPDGDPADPAASERQPAAGDQQDSVGDSDSDPSDDP
jgi:Putative prokaryotic signal transducing protein